MKSALRILNVEDSLPADGWYQVAKKGEHAIASQKDGKPVMLLQVIDDEACASMVNRFNEARAADPLYEPLVDYDHFSEDTDKTSEAAGWIKALENRADGLYAHIQWTDRGQEAVTGRRYRFLSPVWTRQDCADLGNRRVRPLRLDRAAVTNDPNIKGMSPLVNRNDPANPGEGESTMDYKAELLAMLGLPAEATDEDITAARAAKKTELENACTDRDAMKNRAESAELKIAQIEAQALETQVNADLDTYKDRIKNRDEVKAQLLANRAGTLKLLDAMQPTVVEPLRNRSQAQTPADREETTDQSEKARRRGALINRMRAEKGLADFDQARAAAVQADPELFKD